MNDPFSIATTQPESARQRGVSIREALQPKPFLYREAARMSTWREAVLGDHLTFLTSGSRGWSKYVRQTGDLFLRIQNVGRNQLLMDEVAYIQAPKGAEARRTQVQPGDVLLSITADLGRTAVVPDDIGTAYINQHLALLRLRDLHPPFVSAFIGQGPGRRQLLRLDRQGVKSGLNFDDVRSLRIPVPPLPEQKRIAAILDKADAIRRKRHQAIELTQNLLRSAFLEMFGDPVTNPKGWNKVPLATLGRVTTGNTPSRTVSAYSGDAIEWIKSDNINTPGHVLTRAAEGLSLEGKAAGRTAPPGSTLMTCIAGSPDCIGNVALADREVAFNQQINAVTPNPGIDHRYLYVLLLLGKRLVQAASTNGMKGMVSKGRLEQVRMPLAPSEARARFGDAFERVLALGRRQEVAQGNSQVLLDAMVYRTFSGALSL